MIIRYLNSNNEETLINGVLQLNKSSDTLFVALTRSGAELKLRIKNVQGIYLEELDAEHVTFQPVQEERTAPTKKAHVYTDGACKGNPGPGGWGAIVLYDDKEQELFGGAQSTTNNQMELTAVIEALSYLDEPTNVILTTDSQYVVNAIQKGWLENWKNNNWKKPDGSRIANERLWQDLAVLLDKHTVEVVWIKGHAGHVYNERCDKLANKFARKYQRL